MSINAYGIIDAKNTLTNNPNAVSADGFIESQAHNIIYATYIGDRTYSAVSYSPHTGENSCMTYTTINLQKYKSGKTSFKDTTFRLEFDFTWSGYTTGNAWYQGAVNNSWSSGYNWFTKAARELKEITALTTNAASGTYHYNTSVTIGSENTYTFSFGMRSDNANTGTWYQISNLKVIPIEYGNHTINSDGHVSFEHFYEF